MFTYGVPGCTVYGVSRYLPIHLILRVNTIKVFLSNFNIPDYILSW